MQSMKYFVYILTNKSSTLYVGVTNDLIKRMYEHKHSLLEGFTSKYKINKLIYFEQYDEVLLAIQREKEIKGWLRSKKMALVKSKNPLFSEIIL